MRNWSAQQPTGLVGLNEGDAVMLAIIPASFTCQRRTKTQQHTDNFVTVYGPVKHQIFLGQY
jgi:hypothetical protein